MSFKPIFGKSTLLRPVRVSDAQFILDLRTDSTRNQYLSSVEKNLEHQVAWITEYKLREERGEEFYCIVEAIGSGDSLGTVRLYDFKSSSFAWGSWIFKLGAPVFAAIESALLVYDHAFFELGFLNSHFDVRHGNSRVIKFHTQFGARMVRTDNENCYFELAKEEYLNARERYAQFL
jgi:hypothetical protein